MLHEVSSGTVVEGEEGGTQFCLLSMSALEQGKADVIIEVHDTSVLTSSYGQELNPSTSVSLPVRKHDIVIGLQMTRCKKKQKKKRATGCQLVKPGRISSPVQREASDHAAGRQRMVQAQGLLLSSQVLDTYLVWATNNSTVKRCQAPGWDRKWMQC